ncbi:MAG: serine protease [Thermoleophilia bacterium]|nr:serine protease [Thermoleophilia bacterium]
MTSSVVTPSTSLPTDTIIVKLAPRANTGGFSKLPRGAERKTEVWNALVRTAQTSQAEAVKLVEDLKSQGLVTTYESLVSPNALLIDPSASNAKKITEAFQALAGVAAIYDNKGTVLFGRNKLGAAESDAARGQATSGLDVFSRGMTFAELPTVPGITNDDGTPYGLDMIGAGAANAAGADGHGLVFGSIDTGADVTHEAINGGFRGRQADGSLVGDYSWYSFGRQHQALPKDFDAHGTHTVGTATGKKVGVAPGAKWISVAGLEGGLDVRLKALQYMQAPVDFNGANPRPELAPDVVGMSWWTGPQTSDAFRDSMQNLLAAGIVPTKSAGNNGDGPETISSPGQFREVTATAAVDKNGDIAKFSSRGPSPLPHTGTSPDWKPDFAAPGVDVLSSVPGNRYQTMSGTSMAQPHMAGAILDILSAYPQLSNEQLQAVLQASSHDAGAKGRDLEFGFGIIDIPAALAAAAKLYPGQPAPVDAPVDVPVDAPSFALA